MSYDITIFRLKAGCDPQEATRRLNSEEYDIWLEDREQRTQDGEDTSGEPDFWYRFADEALQTEHIEYLVGREYLRVTIPEPERSAEMTAFLATDEPTPWPDEVEDQMAEIFGWASEVGSLTVMLGYGDSLEKELERYASCLLNTSK